MEPMHVQDLPRVQRIAWVLARHGFVQLAARLGLSVDTPGTGDGAPWARRARQALIELGPTFVKLGQVLSLRPDIVPRELMVELQKLHHEVDPMPEEAVRGVLASELIVPFDEVFESFDFTPLGSASIAQVHAAVLTGGEAVAVKVQRADIEPVIHSDLHILYTIAQLLERHVDLPGLYTPTAIIREFDTAIRRELDFLQELEATLRMGSVLSETDVVVPAVHPRWSTRRVMVMDRIDGHPLSDVVDDLPLDARRSLAHQLMDATYRQVFDAGFFHGDPHPGNLFVLPDGGLAYLDFGVTGVLTASMQDTILSTFTALVFRDADTLASTIYRAGATRNRIDLRAFRDALDRKMIEYRGASLDVLSRRETLLEVVEMAKRFEIDLPSEFAILSRALTLVEGNIRRLLPDVDIVAEVRPYAERLMTRRFSPERLARDAGRTLMRLQDQLNDLPTQASQVLMDLDAGRLTLVARDPDAAQHREALRQASARVSLAVVAAGGMIAGVLAPSSAASVAMTTVGLVALLLLLLALVSPDNLAVSSWVERAWKTWRFFSPRRSTRTESNPVPTPRPTDGAQ